MPPAHLCIAALCREGEGTRNWEGLERADRPEVKGKAETRRPEHQRGTEVVAYQGRDIRARADRRVRRCVEEADTMRPCVLWW